MSAVLKKDVTWEKSPKSSLKNQKAAEVVDYDPYDDEVTADQMKALEKAVPDDTFKNYKLKDGPAW